MNLVAFKESLAADAPPAETPLALQALWHAGKGDWQTAHDLANSQHTDDTNWVHAYLHRVEGDQSNASYWYRRVGRDAPGVPVDAEWADIVAALLP